MKKLMLITIALSAMQPIVAMNSTAKKRRFESDQTLWEAARNGNCNQAQQLIDNGAPIDLQTTQDMTALMTAVWYGHHNVVQLLLDNGAQVDLSDEQGTTPLIIAANNGLTNIAQSLIVHHAQIDLPDAEGFTALMIAADNGHRDIVRLLLNNGAQMDLPNIKGWTALMAAAGSGHYHIVRLLLARGAQIDLQSAHGTTALIAAVRSGYHNIVAQLISHIPLNTQHEIRQKLTGLICVSQGNPYLPLELIFQIKNDLVHGLVQDQMDRIEHLCTLTTKEHQTAYYFAVARNYPHLATMLDLGNPTACETIRMQLRNKIKRLLFGEPQQQ